MKHTNCQAVWWSLFFPWKIQSYIIWSLQTDVKLYVHGNIHMLLHVAPRQKPLMNKKEWTASLLKMEPISSPETSVTDYQLTLRNIPEERRLHLHLGWSLKLQIPIFTLMVTARLIGSVNESKHESAIHIKHAVLATLAAGPKLRMLKLLRYYFGIKLSDWCSKLIPSLKNLIGKLQFDDNSLLLHLFIILTICVKLCCP